MIINKLVTLGEIMLRLKSPGFERLFQTPVLEATFGGGESNVAVSVSRFGIHSEFVTSLPDNEIGECVLGELKRHGVETSHIIRSDGRLGIYFIESGANQRPSRVVYDRANSSISAADETMFDWVGIFEGASWFHITGITPALSEKAAETSLRALKEAKKKNINVSIDLNFRKKLWKYGKNAPEIMSELVRYADVVIANEEDCQKCLGVSADQIDVESGHLSEEHYKQLCGKVLSLYPNVSKIAITLRESISANHNNWSAVLHNGNEFIVSRKYEIKNIVDRVGGGDSFSAGLIYCLMTSGNDSYSLEFAVAASCLKHSIPGDMNLVNKDEVLGLLDGDGSGRVQR